MDEYILAIFGLIISIIAAGASYFLYKKLTKKEVVKKFTSDISVIELEGSIGDGLSINLKSLTKDINQLVSDTTKHVIFRIDSCGGDPVESYKIYSYIKRIQTDYPKAKFHVYGDNLLSGGYLIALAFDTIYANPFGMYGSIGVISKVRDFDSFMKNLGLDTFTVKSGSLKEIITDGEFSYASSSMMNDYASHVYDEFKKIMVKSRGDKLVKCIEYGVIEKAGFLSSADALKCGLIDFEFDSATAYRYMVKGNVEEKIVFSYAIKNEKTLPQVILEFLMSF